MRFSSPRRRFARFLEHLEDRTTPNVAFGLTATDLVRFDTSAPGTYLNSVAITGLTAGDVLVGLDLRPFDGKLYALGLNDAADTVRLYTLDGATGAATLVGAPAVTTKSTLFGFDFNPVVDRIRVVGDAGDNFRINPNDGSLAGSDTALTAGNTVTAAAYDRSINVKPDAATAAPAGTLTTLFGIDSVADKLVTIGGIDGTPSPNTGGITPVGPLGIDIDATGNGFDIDGGAGTAFAVLSPTGKGSSLYTIDLKAGTASLIGATASDLVAFAVLPSVVNGTDGDDLIELAPNPAVPQSFLVTINGVPKGAFGNPTTGTTLIDAKAGNDTIRSADGLVLAGVRTDGGAGTDTLDYSLWTTGIAANLGDAAQGDFVFRTTLDGTQQVPPVTTTASGTATLVFNSPAKTFDLRADVAGIAAADLTMSHLHEGAAGTNGGIFLDLGDGKSWTTTPTGLARTVATGTFPDAQVASLLLGNVYINVHTKTFPNGEVRGQLNLTAGVSSATGFAAGGVTNFENATGGSANDTFVGSNGPNIFLGGAGADVLIGRGGNDKLVGDKGADQLFGDSGDDILVWNDGDGSDVDEGGAGNDTVQVNGGAADETFTIAPNGDRVTFTRTSGKSFSLDIGTSELLDFDGGAGADTVTVAPSKTLAFLLDGGDPATAPPGDKLTVDVAGVTSSSVTTPSGSDQGQFTFPGGFQPITFNNFESFAPVTTPFAVGAGAGGSPVARVFSPAGTSLYDVTAFDGSFTGGVRVATADFNGDGVLDLVVGSGPGIATSVRVLDGVTKAELFAVAPFEETFKGGVYVAAGDVDGDGLADLAIAPDEGGGPRVRLFTGNKFAQIQDFLGIEDPNFRGGARPAIGDIDGDGFADLVVAAGFGGGPRIAAFSGKSLATTPVKLFADFFAFESSLRNGTFVASGDVDGDGFAELIAGGGPGGGPRVTVFDGSQLLSNTQVRTADFFAGDVENRGGIRLATKDLDGDDNADLVVGAGTGAGSRVTAYAGSSLIGGAPPQLLSFDAFAGFTGGVYVG